MTTLRRLLLSLGFLLFATAAHAQTTTSLVWDYKSTTPAYVAAGAQTVTADTVPVTTTITCGANAVTPSDTTCRVVLPASATTAGAHTYVVTLVAEGVERSTTTAIDPSKGRQPSTFRIETKTTVTITNP